MPGSMLSGSSYRNRSAYRVVNRGALVDETLFGNGNRSSGIASAKCKDISIVGKDTVQVRNKYSRSNSVGGGKTDAVVIPASELSRLRDNATLLSKEEEMEIKQRAEEAYAERMKKSQTRKEKMMQMEEVRKRNALLQEGDKDGRAQKNSVLERAKQMLDEDMDDVKQMNQMMLYSKIVTIRDAQILERRQIQAEKEEEERQLDMMMEIERLKALQQQEEREKTRREDQRRGAAVIIDQIKERQTYRMRDEEQRDLDRAFVQKQIECLKQEEAEQQHKKQAAVNKLMVDVQEAHQVAMQISDVKMSGEKLEDMKIIGYIDAKAARDREFEEERQRRAAEKEKEIARLRAMQEKAQDKAAEMDALRAKRALEASERAHRAKDKQEREHLEAINKELNAARKQQQAEKERRLGEQAKKERDEFERTIQVQIQKEEAEHQKDLEEREKRKQHAAELRAQISIRESKSLQERRAFLEEGNAMRNQIGSEKRKLEKIKSRKIEELQKVNVPEKYCAELARKKISI